MASCNCGWMERHLNIEYWTVIPLWQVYLSLDRERNKSSPGWFLGSGWRVRGKDSWKRYTDFGQYSWDKNYWTMLMYPSPHHTRFWWSSLCIHFLDIMQSMVKMFFWHSKQFYFVLAMFFNGYIFSSQFLHHLVLIPEFFASRMSVYR